MPHAIYVASSGRSKCRACKTTIKKGELRLGEEVPNAFGEGQAVHWYHLLCGARRRSSALLDALNALQFQGSASTSVNSDSASSESTEVDSVAPEPGLTATELDGSASEPVPGSASIEELREQFSEVELDEMRQIAARGSEFYRLERFVKAAVAPSGRARCQGCRELIEKGALRFVLERIEDGMVSGAGFVHIGCAHAYAGAVDGILQRVRALSELSDEEWTAVEKSLADQATLPRELKVPGGES